MADTQVYKAMVTTVCPHGLHGPYAVALFSGQQPDSYITFSLDSKVWKEDEWPETGVYVILSKIRKNSAGWRANHGRFLRPSDEQPLADASAEGSR